FAPNSRIYTLSLHDALPICGTHNCRCTHTYLLLAPLVFDEYAHFHGIGEYSDGCILGKESGYTIPERTTKGTSKRIFLVFFFLVDRKSTRLNSSHVAISYAV